MTFSGIAIVLFLSTTSFLDSVVGQNGILEPGVWKPLLKCPGASELEWERHVTQAIRSTKCSVTKEVSWDECRQLCNDDVGCASYVYDGTLCFMESLCDQFFIETDNLDAVVNVDVIVGLPGKPLGYAARLCQCNGVDPKPRLIDLAKNAWKASKEQVSQQDINALCS